MEASQHKFETPNVHETLDPRVQLELMREEKATQRAQMANLAMQGLIQNQSASGVVSPEASRQAHHIAVEQVTGEHRVPVTLH
jgi:hypothetical protein